MSWASQGRTALGERAQNSRNLDVEEFDADVRIDVTDGEDFRAVFSSGFANTSGISITGIGSYQVDRWALGYFQTRISHKDLFAQVFYNFSDAGDKKTFNLRTGDYIAANAKQFVTQVQHGMTLAGARQRFTYGVDLLLTRPNSRGTVYGKNEEDDDLNQIGAYVQS